MFYNRKKINLCIPPLPNKREEQLSGLENQLEVSDTNNVIQLEFVYIHLCLKNKPCCQEVDFFIISLFVYPLVAVICSHFSYQPAPLDMCVFFVGFDVFLIPSNCAIFIFSPYQINSHSFLLFMKWVICGFLSFSKNCFVLVSFMKIKIT